jgi:hypothetical protein
MQADEKKKSALVKVAILFLFIAAAIYLVRFSPANGFLRSNNWGCSWIQQASGHL